MLPEPRTANHEPRLLTPIHIDIHMCACVLTPHFLWCMGVGVWLYVAAVCLQVKVVCSSANIPKTLELDITGMEIGQRMFLRDIQVCVREGGGSAVFGNRASHK